LLGLGRHTLTGCLSTLGAQQQDWSADYRLYSARRAEPEAAFGTILAEAGARVAGRLWLGLDDSTLRKSGRRIPQTGWRRDPLSPPFAVNFQWGQRIVQSSLLFPSQVGPARGLPVDFCVLPQAGKTAPPEERRAANVNVVAAARLAKVRAQLPAGRALVAAVDGRFTNRTFLRGRPAEVAVVGRVRKDTALFFAPAGQAATGRRRLYGQAAPSPEALRTDESRPWERVPVFAAGTNHEMKIKVLGPVRSRLTGGADVRVIVIAPLGYRLRKQGKLLYRQPAYLLVTDPALSVAEAVQGYVWRWEVEVNFREEKTLFGVGQAQVRHPESVERVPALQVAAYSALLWASELTGAPACAAVPAPRWRRRAETPPRPSTAALLNQLRSESWAGSVRPESLRALWAPRSQDQNAPKLVPNLASAVFLAAA
jgi:hypothetical protein